MTTKRKGKAKAFANSGGAVQVRRYSTAKPDALRPVVTPAMVDDDFATAMLRAATGLMGADKLLAMWDRSARRIAAVERETAAMFGVARTDQRNRKVLASHEREKPTRDRAALGEFELIDALKFDTTRKGERILMDWRARAGGAGDMYVRNQISVRELAAAVKICELAEWASAGQMSGGGFDIRSTNGGATDAGERLMSAGWAAGEYRAALDRLSRVHRFLVEHRVVLGLPMEEVVRLNGAAARLGNVSIRVRCERAVGHLAEGLDALADVFGLGG